MKRILVIGATSAIAKATARLWAGQGSRMHLLARHEERLRDLAQDLEVRGAKSVTWAVLDVLDFARHEEAIAGAFAALGGIDVALVAHGSLGDQKACEVDVRAALHELNTNAVSVVSLLTLLANLLAEQGPGTLAVLGSVAGDRGRQSNYVYGAAKGLVAIFLAGLRHRFYRSGIRVLTVKPGFVDTPMTAEFAKGPLWTTPDRVARDILRALARRRNVLYTPWFWRPIMLVVTHLPGAIFNRTRL